MSWWQRNIVEPGKLPLLLCTAAFLVTFVTTRIIVRLIRAGRGPFRNNVSAGGMHVHHVVPGTILMVAGGLLALSTVTDATTAVAGAVFGTGLALVLDEFALILHLDDVYWEAQGRLSVDAVFVVAGLLALLLLGLSPAGVDDLGSTAQTARWAVLGELVVVLGCAVIACLKGKVVLALLGLFVPFLGVVVAIRLGRPGSPWARWRYPAGSARLARAQKRASRYDRSVGRFGRRVQDLVAGAPGIGPALKAIPGALGPPLSEASPVPEATNAAADAEAAAEAAPGPTTPASG